MQIIEPSVKCLGFTPLTIKEQVPFIEKIARTCYKSEDRITDESADKFVKDILIRHGHFAMIEHSNFVIKCRLEPEQYFLIHNVLFNTMLNVAQHHDHNNSLYNSNDYYIGGNLTAWYKAYMSEPERYCSDIYKNFFDTYKDLFNLPHKDFHHLLPLIGITDIENVTDNNQIPESLKRISFNITTDRGVTHELVRHRLASYAQESTRYVDYKNKPIQFIKPYWYTEENNEADDHAMRQSFLHSCEDVEKSYNRMRKYGASPQEARAVLSNAVKTEINITTSIPHLQYIINLRESKEAHPDMRNIIKLLKESMI